MAQAGFTPIQLYRTTTASAQPTAGNLAAGELAINLTDKKLYAKDASNNVFVLADASSGGTTATNLAGGAAGSVPYQSGANATVFRAIGTAGQVLQVNAGATAPEWVSSSGTGNVARVTSPSFTTPSLGAATALSINSLTLTTSTGTFTLANGKTLTVNNSLTLSGTDATTMTFPSTNATIARTDAAQTFTGTQTVRAAATQDAVALAGRAGGTSSFVSTLTPTTLSASRTVTLPDADTTVPVATQVLTFTGPTAGRTITLPDANFTVARSDAAQSFTGTQTFLSNPVLDAGTANGVLYLDGSKVVTSGSALTFDGASALTISRASGVGNTQITLSNNGAGASGFQLGQSAQQQQFFIYDTGAAKDRYIINSSGEHLWFGASEQMRLNSTGVGIGTNNPTQKLTVSGSAAFSRIGFNANAIDTVSAAQSFVRFQTTGGDFYVGTEGGVGGVFFPSSTAYAAVLYNANSTPMQFYTASELRATLDSSGNLGLGVTPSAWGGGYKGFQVTRGASLGSNDANSLVLGQNWYYNGSNDLYITSDFSTAYQQVNGTHRWLTAPSGTAGNAISFTQAMTLDASGNLGVGVTSPTAKLHVYEPTAAATRIRVLANGGQQAALQLAGNGTTFGTTSFDVFQDGGSDAYVANRANASLLFWTNNTERARIPAAGGIVVGTAALATTATDGFLYVPTCAGTPTGTPTTQTGTAPIVINTTNNKLYFYSGGQWRDAGP